MELKPPRKRKGAPPKAPGGPPLPIFIETPCGFVADDSLAPVFRGCYNGCSVIVDNPEEMKMLFRMGYFGKGSLSRSFPNFGLGHRGKPPFIFETQWQRRKEWMDKIQNAFGLCIPPEESGSNVGASQSERSDSERPDTTGSTGMKDSDVSHKDSPLSSKDCDVLVVKDLNKKGLDPRPRLETELVQTVVEVSHLSLEEAFFLCYGLGCLEITNLAGNLLSPNECWDVFRRSQKDFIECYVAYHHYRAKGWVVKSGLKYGGHFVLYTSKGPTFYHASYVVIVENVGKPDSKQSDGEGLWDKYSTLNRVAEQANKEVISCQVEWPPSADYNSPKVISQFRVKDCLIGRWNASANLSLED